MTDDSPGILSALPARPLTKEEGDALDDQETESVWVRPESILMTDDGEVVIALAAVNREKETLHLLGYSPEAKGWVVVDEWDEADVEHDLFYARLDEWEAETFMDHPDFHLG